MKFLTKGKRIAKTKKRAVPFGLLSGFVILTAARTAASTGR